MMRGKPEHLEDMCNKILWLWLAIGLQISWNKGTCGSSVEWIGACLELRNHDKSVVLTVTEDKLDEWRSLLKRLNTKPTVSRKLLVQFTGKMSWASGFLLQLKPFVRMLHSALAMDSKVTAHGSVYYKQVQPAIEWFQHFFQDIKGSLRWGASSI